MQVATISSKRQITLPKHIMEEAGMKPGSKILLEEGEKGLFLKPLASSLVEKTAGSLTKFVSPSKLGVSFEEIMEKTREKTARKLGTP